jgi:type II secretory pathway component PulL
VRNLDLVISGVCVCGGGYPVHAGEAAQQHLEQTVQQQQQQDASQQVTYLLRGPRRTRGSWCSSRRMRRRWLCMATLD